MLWAMDIYFAMSEFGMKQETPWFLLIFLIFPSFINFLDFDISKNYLVSLNLKRYYYILLKTA